MADDAQSGFPADHGLRMPAEWERHAATWITWPHAPDDWPGKSDSVSWVFAEIVRHLHRSEPVHVVVSSPHIEAQAKDCLKQVDPASEHPSRVAVKQIVGDRNGAVQLQAASTIGAPVADDGVARDDGSQVAVHTKPASLADLATGHVLRDKVPFDSDLGVHQGQGAQDEDAAADSEC